MSSLSKELILLVLQFLDEEKFKDSVHHLERESGLFFNMNYVEDSVLKGEWDKLEEYLLGFTKIDDNRYSMKIFFEIRKQKYLEALDKNDRLRAIEILGEDLKVFSTFNQDIFKELSALLPLANFRENDLLSNYGDEKAARAVMLIEVKKLIESNPLLQDKLQFPAIRNSRLRTLINQSLNWQHQLCKSPKPNPDIRSLLVDHTCGQSNAARAPSPVPNPLMSSMPIVGGFSPLAPHGVVQAPQGMSLGGWSGNPSSAPHQVVSAGPSIIAPNNAVSMLKRPITPPTNNPAMDYQPADSEHVVKRPRPFGLPEEVNNPLINMLPVTYPGQSLARTSGSPDDLPKTVVANLNQGSAVKSMDFHPLHQTLLLVGTSNGDITIWEVGTRERLVSRNFVVWEIGKCTMTLQAKLANEYSASVNRVLWSSNGALLGVAYSKHIVHVYSYRGGEDLQNHLEIDAHVGSVSDIAFANPDKRSCIVTSGEDKTIKVWDAADGTKLHIFEGHEAPVYSLCSHAKQDIQYIFSTGTDGKIKAWLFDNTGLRVDYVAPGHPCVRLAYSVDGTRLFSCGTTKEGESSIIEWNDNDAAVKRTYHGLGKRSVGVVQFDICKRFLAAGDESAIKYWDMDNANVLTTTDAEGGLPASPSIRFSKEGMLLAVSTNENGVKILANPDGARLIRSVESRTLDASGRISSGSAAKVPIFGSFSASSSAVGTNVNIIDRKIPIMPNGDGRVLPEMKPRNTDEIVKSNVWKLTELEQPSQICSRRLPDNLLPVRISRLTYINSGKGILALAFNAVHKLWRWQTNNMNVGITDISPQLWQPSSGILMTNNITQRSLEESIPCFALSKNDSYVMSASGGQVSLFNMMTFKTMATCAEPPPAATSLAFLPDDNNIIAIGTEDSSTLIYDIRFDEVKSKLRGHQKSVTGLAFSNILKVLVSSGADAQLCVWSVNGWDKQTSKFLQIPSGQNPTHLASTRLQFHQDEVHLLVVHETLLAIYDARNLDCIKQWVPQDSYGLITDATYSCDSQSIYASFEDGCVGIFVANTLKQRCRISPTAYLPPNPSSVVLPLVIAANPHKPNQFAVGLSDGGVHVLEPLRGEGNWGTVPPLENVVAPGTRCGSDQQSRE